MSHVISELDDGNHYPPDDDIRFQESWCLAWYDPHTRLGGFHHFGLQRPRGIADSWSWMMHEGRLVHKFQNNELPLPEDDMRDLRLQPFHLKTITPLVERAITIDHEGFHADLTYKAFVPPFAQAMTTKGAQIAKAHYETCGRLTGTVKLPGRDIEISALCFQDNSWGNREYDKILSHRWLWACFGDDLFLSAFHITGPDGSMEMGYIFDSGRFHVLTRVDVNVEMSSDGVNATGCRLTVWTAEGRAYRLKGTCDGASMHTHRGGFIVSDACTLWEMGGRVGVGITEVNELKRPTNEIRRLLNI